jgi:chemotaxis signal transduction protein
MTMQTLVNFRSSGRHYCIPVGHTLGVRRADGLVPLPAPRAGVVGILPSTEPLTVLALLGTGCEQVLVLGVGDQTFGLLVEEVTGLTSVDEAEIQMAPNGQDEAYICGVINDGDSVVLVADAHALAARL